MCIHTHTHTPGKKDFILSKTHRHKCLGRHMLYLYDDQGKGASSPRFLGFKPKVSLNISILHFSHKISFILFFFLVPLLVWLAFYSHSLISNISLTTAPLLGGAACHSVEHCPSGYHERRSMIKDRETKAGGQT